ncbi:FecR family protein [Verticiella sediminum]|uniref:FecR family protein n=1 Tax=Verticiella sediminum TaxID=1247510 RepID=UPI001FEB9345|nr:FecR domain-containing protein [Verticiella sediminum]
MPSRASTSHSAPTPRPPPRRLIEHALSLIGRAQHGEPCEAEAARSELAEWRQANPEHESAFETASRYWSATDASALKGSVPLPLGRPARARRRALTALGVAGLAAAMGAGMRWAWLLPIAEYALATGRGQLLGHDLLDGSRIDLAANTTGQVAYYRHRREVRLLAGEMRFDVRPDAGRPFVVVTDWGHVRVLGTVFSVAVRDQRMRVEVAHGRVAVRAVRWNDARFDAPTGSDMVLEASEAVEVDGAGFGRLTHVRAQSVGAWRDGWLVFNGTPLPQAIARWNDYLPRPLRLADSAALRDMRLTGSFPARDPSAFLQNLPDILPVRVVRESGAIVLYPRP